MIELKKVSKTFKNEDGTYTRALHNINLTFEKNGITFITGDSGNGKSTLLNIIAGLDKADSGDVIVDGISFKSLSENDFDFYRNFLISFMFQDFNLIESLNVEENIKIARCFGQTPPSDEEVQTILKTLKISNCRFRKVNKLSSGQKQRVSIARIFVQKPKILFLDEPTAHLDKKNKKIIWDLIQKISENCIVIAVTHDEWVIDNYADRVVELDENTILSDKIMTPLSEQSQSTTESAKKESVSAPVWTKQDLMQKYKGISNASAFKFGLTNLTSKRWKTAFMVIVSMFSLVFFGLFAMLNNFNKYEALSIGVDSEYSAYVNFYNENQISLNTISNENIAEVLEKTNYADKDFYHFYNVNYSTNIAPSINTGMFRNFQITGMVALDNDNTWSNNLNPLNQNILYGSYPNSPSTRTNNVVISDFVARLIMEYGIINEANLEVKPIFFDVTEEGYNSELGTTVINSQLKIGENFYTICGIYNTDYESYIMENSFAFDNTKNQEMFNYNLKNVYGAVHVSSEFISAKNLERYRTALILETSNLNTSSLSRIIEDLNNIGYEFQSVTSSAINNLCEKQNILKNVFLGISIFAGVFTMILMYYFISSTIQDKKRDMGVLKALGATNWDIAQIFLISTGLFVLISFALTLIAITISAVIVNSVISTSLAFNFNILNLTYSTYFALFGMSLLVSFLGAYIPLRILTRLTPSEIIKG